MASVKRRKLGEDDSPRLLTANIGDASKLVSNSASSSVDSPSANHVEPVAEEKETAKTFRDLVGILLLSFKTYLTVPREL